MINILVNSAITGSHIQSLCDHSFSHLHQLRMVALGYTYVSLHLQKRKKNIPVIGKCYG